MRTVLAHSSRQYHYSLQSSVPLLISGSRQLISIIRLYCNLRAADDWLRSNTTICEFYIHCSLHRDSLLMRSNEIQQYAGVYLLQNHSNMFQVSIAPIIRSTSNCNCSFWYRSYCKVQKFELEVQYNKKWRVKQGVT